MIHDCNKTTEKDDGWQDSECKLVSTKRNCDVLCRLSSDGIVEYPRALSSKNEESTLAGIVQEYCSLIRRIREQQGAQVSIFV